MDLLMKISIINTKLRDFSESLEDICYDLDINYEEFIEELNNSQYYYDESLGQIKQK